MNFNQYKYVGQKVNSLGRNGVIVAVEVETENTYPTSIKFETLHEATSFTTDGREFAYTPPTLAFGHVCDYKHDYGEPEVTYEYPLYVKHNGVVYRYTSLTACTRINHRCYSVDCPDPHTDSKFSPVKFCPEYGFHDKQILLINMPDTAPVIKVYNIDNRDVYSDEGFPTTTNLDLFYASPLVDPPQAMIDWVANLK